MKYKHILCIIISTAACLSAGASNESVRTYSHRYVDLTIYYNYSYEPLGRLLECEAMAVILDNYAAQLVGEGRLDGDKRIDLLIGGTVFMSPPVEVWRNDRRYHVTLHEWPDLRRLMQVVEYCASPDWESLVYPEIEQYENALELFDRRLARYAPEPDMPAASGVVTVYRDGEIEIRYRNGTLSVYADDQRLPGMPNGSPMKLGSIYPVKFGDRYIVFYEDAVYVYIRVPHIETENLHRSEGSGKPDILLTYPYPGDTRYEKWSHDYFTEVYGDWMNVYYNSRDYPVFSYSYSRNRFYNYRPEEKCWK